MPIPSAPTFHEVLEFIMPFFRGNRSVRGTTYGHVVRPDTPCHDFFPVDVDAIRINFAKEIDEKFGLQQFNFQWVSNPLNFKGLGIAEEAFREKYPEEEIGTEIFTLARFAEMVYDLIRIKNGLDIS